MADLRNHLKAVHPRKSTSRVVSEIDYNALEFPISTGSHTALRKRPWNSTNIVPPSFHIHRTFTFGQLLRFHLTDVRILRCISCSSLRNHTAAAAAKSLQSCPTLCDPIDAAHQAPPSLEFSRQEHWSGIAVSFSNAWQWKVKVKSLSRVWPSATPWIAAFQAPPSMGFSRQEYWSGVPLPSPKKSWQTANIHQWWPLIQYLLEKQHVAFSDQLQCYSQ